ncbi:hypothetical protein PP1_001150 [Pseudonocardia sp. P1]
MSDRSVVAAASGSSTTASTASTGAAQVHNGPTGPVGPGGGGGCPPGPGGGGGTGPSPPGRGTGPRTAVVGESGPGGATNCVRSLGLSSTCVVRPARPCSPRDRADGSGPPVRRVSDVTTSPPWKAGGSTPGRI